MLTSTKRPTVLRWSRVYAWHTCSLALFQLQPGIESFGDIWGARGSLWAGMAGETTERKNDIPGQVQRSFVWDLLPHPCTGIWHAPCDTVFVHPCHAVFDQLFWIKVVKCKLFGSSSMIVGMTMPYRAVCSSTYFFVICLWTSWKLGMTLIYFRVEQSHSVISHARWVNIL